MMPLDYEPEPWVMALGFQDAGLMSGPSYGPRRTTGFAQCWSEGHVGEDVCERCHCYVPDGPTMRRAAEDALNDELLDATDAFLTAEVAPGITLAQKEQND